MKNIYGIYSAAFLSAAMFYKSANAVADATNFDGFYGNFGLGMTSLNGSMDHKDSSQVTNTAQNGIGHRFVAEGGFGFGTTSDNFYFGVGAFVNNAGAKVDLLKNTSNGKQSSISFEKSSFSWGPNVKLGYVFNPTSMFFVSVSGQYDRFNLKFKQDKDYAGANSPQDSLNETVSKNHFSPVVGLGAEMHIGGNSFVQVKVEHKFGGKVTHKFENDTTKNGSYAGDEVNFGKLHQQTAMVSYVHRF